MVDYFEESTAYGAPSCSVIFLHGLGASADDLRPLSTLMYPEGVGVRSIFLNAPLLSLKAFGGELLRSWFDMSVIDWERPIPEDQGLGDSFQRVSDVILRQREAGIASDRIFLCGFSQGGYLALYSALRMPFCVGGVLALSPFMRKKDLTFPLLPEAENIPLFLGEGRDDQVIPEPVRQETSLVLKDVFKKDMMHRSYAMGHEVCEQEIGDLKAWLAERLV